MTAEATLNQTLNVLRRGAHTLRSTLTLALNAVERVDQLVATASHDSRQVAHDAARFWTALAASATRLAATARATPRVAAVLAELVRLAAVYRFTFIKATLLPEAAAATYLATVHAREGDRVRRFCERHGGGLMKLGQLLSARGDLLPAPFVDALVGLQDAAPPPPPEAVESALDAWLPNWRDAFTLESPLAAASLAVVYRGRLTDGTPVAIKVQRPEVEQLLTDDRAALTLLGNLLGELGLEGLDLRPILAEVADSLSEELDFAAEHAMAARFAAALPPHLCRAPAPHLAPHPRVLVLDLIEGQRLREALDTADAPVAALLRDLAETYAHALLVHGLAHGDPHPGNALALPGPGPRLALLDFGSAIALTPSERRAYLGLLVGLLGRQRAPLLAALLALGFTRQGQPAPQADLETLADDLIALPRPDLATLDPRVELERGLELMRSHSHLTMPGHMVRLGRALGTLGGLFLTHQDALADLDLSRLLMKVVFEANR